MANNKVPSYEEFMELVDSHNYLFKLIQVIYGATLDNELSEAERLKFIRDGLEKVMGKI